MMRSKRREKQSVIDTIKEKERKGEFLRLYSWDGWCFGEGDSGAVSGSSDAVW